jgi:hypothetical protein
MKQITKEKTMPYMVYQAVDGTEFDNAEECLQYEKSAFGMLNAKLKKYIVWKGNEYELWRIDTEYNTIAVELNTQEAVDTLLHIYYLQHSYLLLDEHKKRREVFEALVDETFKNKDLLILGINCDNECYYIDSRNNIVNRLLNLDKKDDSEGTDK